MLLLSLCRLFDAMGEREEDGRHQHFASDLAFSTGVATGRYVVLLHDEDEIPRRHIDSLGQEMVAMLTGGDGAVAGGD